ncbi:hypothetical protein DCAR_0522452 [Daucus carota subsp. sativus]|uniref:Peptidase S26 domain-containing protein n=1 Tax=Daucus carota subsp. sativus TaxID=79200 RepID=A0AAF0XB43_DAUCS|nr:PREDICTED: mitochondrial inner membrane protease subunit 1 [Daucus carota subsp. sativus]WOH03061.1 hypothetical protein DCAR_0522452 [Daucus carota subsp. sativus]
MFARMKPLVKEALNQTLIFGKFLCLLHITDKYICSPIIVHGPSMLPTMNLTGDVILAEHISSRFGKLSVGDVVLVSSPENPRKTVTKRILGLEGDKVAFLVDPSFGSGNYRTIVVPKGHVWIQGDNIYASKDSRHFGPVPYGLIHGKVFCRLWPPDGFGWLDQ